MRHRKNSFKNGRKPAHRRAMLANLGCSLLRSGRVETTIARAKEVRRLVEPMITLAKDGSLAARRRAISILGQQDVVRYLFNDLAASYQQRQGGYTRIIKTGTRHGDAAEMCFIELVHEPLSDQPEASASEPDSEVSTENATASRQT